MFRNISLLLLLLVAVNASPPSRFSRQDECAGKTNAACDASVSSAQRKIQGGQDITDLCSILETCPLQCYDGILASKIAETCKIPTPSDSGTQELPVTPPGSSGLLTTVSSTVSTTTTDVTTNPTTAPTTTTEVPTTPTTAPTTTTDVTTVTSTVSTIITDAPTIAPPIITNAPTIAPPIITNAPTAPTTITDVTVPTTPATFPTTSSLPATPEVTEQPVTSLPPVPSTLPPLTAFTSTVVSLTCEERMVAAGKSIEFLNGAIFVAQYEPTAAACRNLNNHYQIDPVLNEMRQYCSEAEANDMSRKLQELRIALQCPPY